MLHISAQFSLRLVILAFLVGIGGVVLLFIRQLAKPRVFII